MQDKYVPREKRGDVKMAKHLEELKMRPNKFVFHLFVFCSKLNEKKNCERIPDSGILAAMRPI